MKKIILGGSVIVVLTLIAIAIATTAQYVENETTNVGPFVLSEEKIVTYHGKEIPIIPDVPRDGIPPLDFPKYESIRESRNWMEPDDIVVGVEINDDARAYPIKILNFHEIVNETIGGKDLVVTYCPLCRSGIVFDRVLDDQVLSFGNTGSLFESAMVMYDRETMSYWYHISGEALTGELEGKKLTIFPSSMVTWSEWQKMHPKTCVLSLETGHDRGYLGNPYFGYDARNSRPGFPVSEIDERLPAKEKVIGVTINGISKAYPIRSFENETIRDTIGGAILEVVGGERETAQIYIIRDGMRELAPSSSLFWFAWAAANPNTLIYEKGESQSALQNEIITLPVVLHPVRESDAVSTVRSDDNVRAVFTASQAIWDQADIAFDVSIQPVILDETLSAAIDSGQYNLLFTQSFDEPSIRIFFVRHLRGSNGIAIGNGMALVADVTTVNDFRATAHEIGHLLGLGHTKNSRERLMFQGANGIKLAEDEIEQTRNAARAF